MSYIKRAFEDAARDAAKVVTVDPERQKAFLAGCEWLAKAIMGQLSESAMENLMDKGTKEYCASLTLKNIREILSEALKTEYVKP